MRRASLRSAWLVAGLATVIAGCGPRALVDYSDEELRKIAQHVPLGPPPADPTNAVVDDPAAARLGQLLFFDPRLSSNGGVSCASCHVPALGWSNGQGAGQGIGVTARHVPTLLNNAYGRWFFWDGRADSTWSQAIQPLENLAEHGADRTRLAHRVHDDPALRAAYEAVFGPLPDLSNTRRFPASAAPVPDELPRARAWESMSPRSRKTVNQISANLGKAIAAYERKIVSRDSPFDRFAAALFAVGDSGAADDAGGDIDALSAAAQRGLRIFVGKGSCRLCHSGPNFSDGEFHDTGVPGVDLGDTGRYGGVQRLLRDPFNSAGAYSDGVRPELRYLKRRAESVRQFKTPTLRDVALTAPYMHNGRLASLAEVLRFYSTREGAVVTHAERGMLKPLDLSNAELADLKAFLESLTGAPLAPELTRPLPRV